MADADFTADGHVDANADSLAQRPEQPVVGLEDNL